MRRARELRRAMSLPEGLLWRLLRRRGLGARFRRQHPFPPYVLDFYCPEARLVIELDGEAHDRGNRPERDAKRDAFLQARGFQVIRIAAAEILRDVEAVANAIGAVAAKPLHRPRAVPLPMHGMGRNSPSIPVRSISRSAARSVMEGWFMPVSE